jgi:hypothetical protein
MPNIPSGGSVEHFYHFLLSYFLPLDRYVARYHPAALLVRTCGPMDEWFALLDPATQIVAVPASEAAQQLRSSRQKRRPFPSLENRMWNRRRLVAAARTRVLARVGLAESVVKKGVTLINRAPSLPFYLDQAEVKTSGAERRSIPNIDALTDALRGVAPVDIFEGEYLTPREQIRRMRETSILMGQHGAGLVNMIWMEKGGVVIEVLPRDLGGSQRGLFRDLARVCGHSYVVINQEGWHAPVDVSEAARVVAGLAPVIR